MDKSFETAATAVELLQRSISLIGTDIPAWLDLFAEDARVDFPYAASAGLPAALVGKSAIAAYFERTPAVFTGFQFTSLRLLAVTDPRWAVAEVHGSATLARSGNAYEQDYVMVLMAEHGRVQHYREYWNPLAAPELLEGWSR